MGSTERGAFRTRRLLWINKLGRFHHLTTVSLGNRLDGFHIGAKYRQSEFAIRGGIRVKVDPKTPSAVHQFPIEGRRSRLVQAPLLQAEALTRASRHASPFRGRR